MNEINSDPSAAAIRKIISGWSGKWEKIYRGRGA